MKRSLLYALILSVALTLLFSPALAFAKPGHDNSQVTITGPGLTGTLYVADYDVQANLSPYNYFEQMSPYVTAPAIAEDAGYLITFYVKNLSGKFEAYESARYVPLAAGPGYLYFADLIRNTGGWFQFSAAADAQYQSLLRAAGVTIIPSVSARPEPLSAPVVESAPVAVSAPVTVAYPAGLLFPLGILLISLLALGGVMFQLRTSPTRH